MTTAPAARRTSLFALALTSTAVLAQDSAPKSIQKIDWLSDLAAAEKIAAKSGKPLFLVFR